MKRLNFIFCVFGVLVANLFFGHSVFAKCKGRGGEIAATFCVKFHVKSVEPSRTWWATIWGKPDYGCSKTAVVDVTSLQIPRAELQFKEIEKILKVGDEIKIGIPADYPNEIKTQDDIAGIIEEHCYDLGEPEFSFILNK